MGNFWASSEYMVFDFIFLSYMQHSKVKKEKTALSFHGAKGALLSSHLVTKAPPTTFLSKWVSSGHQTRGENLTQGFKMTREHQRNSCHHDLHEPNAGSTCVVVTITRSWVKLFLVLLNKLTFLFIILPRNLWQPNSRSTDERIMSYSKGMTGSAWFSPS